MADLYDELVEFEILGGLEYSEAEKEKLVDQAYELGLDLNDFETWEEIQQAVDGLRDDL
jgi:hypothetical protein